jgi:endonuclease I
MKIYKCRIKLFVAMFFIASSAIAQPINYYDAAQGKTGEALKTALHNIIKGHTAVSYDYIWTAFQTTDKRADGKVWDIYSNCNFDFGINQCGNYTNECDCYNREHSVPGSWYSDGAPMNSYIFHIIPTDGKVNNIRSNYPYGKVDNPSTTTLNGSKLGSCSWPGYSGTVFEPVDEYKGDIARIYFYMATRYEDVISGWYNNSPQADAALQNNSFPVFENWFLEMLGEWHVNDPVSQKEIDRNNAVYAIQQNRNPFVDHPEWVYDIWSVGFMLQPEPDQHVTNFSAHTITLQWSDAQGPVLPDGYLIRMSNTGFENIMTPQDGTTITDDFWNKNVSYGAQKATFGELTPGTLYYFKIFSYSGNGNDIDYKTDGEIQQVSIKAR